MQVSKEEILHIANLANLYIKEDELEKYMLNLQDILNFANIVNNAPTDGVEEAKNVHNVENVLRKDEIKKFEDLESLLQNAPEQESHMFRIPKVINN